MDVTYLLKKRSWQANRLLAFGFTGDGGTYALTTRLADTGLDISLAISHDVFTVTVIDPDLGEPYEPFEMPFSSGAFVSTVREAAFAFVSHVVEACSESTNLKERVATYVQEAYGTEPEQQWEKYPEFLTLRGPTGKWYGLIMTIPWDRLGIARKGVVDVMNVKLPIAEIAALTDNERYFPAYHMNKKYWLTVLLEGGASWDDVRHLVDESYALTQTGGRKEQKKTAKRGTQEWLIPSNLKYYDLIKAFNATDTLAWHYHVDIQVGDCVYMYVTAPSSAILYKCVVTEIGLSPDEKGRKRFRMQRLARYPRDLITVDVMRQCGSGPVRSERSMPAALSEKIKELTM